jgi:ribosomal protein L40E
MKYCNKCKTNKPITEFYNFKKEEKICKRCYEIRRRSKKWSSLPNKKKEHYIIWMWWSKNLDLDFISDVTGILKNDLINIITNRGFIDKNKKPCPICNKIKSITKFTSTQQNPAGRCRKCMSKYLRENYYPNNSDKFIKTARSRYDKIFKNATPSWADLDKIKEIYKLAKILTEQTGIQYEVDHIIPINNMFVCGLHVETNLQVITKEENRRKSNKFKDNNIV